MRPFPWKIGYRLTQKVSVIERGLKKPEWREEYTCHALLLLNSMPSESTWSREIVDYVGSESFFKDLRQRQWIPRWELQEAHEGHLASRRTSFGGLSELEFSSDLHNSAAWIVGDDDWEPVPYDRLYWPTILPSLPDGPIVVGQAWQGSLELSYEVLDARIDPETLLLLERLMEQDASEAVETSGATEEIPTVEEEEDLDGVCEFGLDYTARVVDMAVADPVIEISLLEEEALFEGDYGLIAMYPAGTWKVVLSTMDAAPVLLEGWCHLKVRSASQEGAPAVESLDLLDCRTEFKIQREPLGFDASRVYGAA
jgi:hypothetical protein